MSHKGPRDFCRRTKNSAHINYNKRKKEEKKDVLNVELGTYILIGHVPVWPLSIGHHLPHDDSVTPYITGRGEFPVLDSFWCGPADGDFPTLLYRIKGSGRM